MTDESWPQRTRAEGTDKWQVPVAYYSLYPLPAKKKKIVNQNAEFPMFNRVASFTWNFAQMSCAQQTFLSSMQQNIRLLAKQGRSASDNTWCCQFRNVWVVDWSFMLQGNFKLSFYFHKTVDIGWRSVYRHWNQIRNNIYVFITEE